VREVWGLGQAPVEALEVPLRSLAIARRGVTRVPVRLGPAMKWWWAAGPNAILPTRNDLLHRHYVALCEERYAALQREVPVEDLVRQAFASCGCAATIEGV